MDLQSATQRERICLIEAQCEQNVQLLEVVAALAKRIEELEKRLRQPPDGPALTRKRAVKARANRSQGERKPRKKRSKGYGRKRSKPTG